MRSQLTFGRVESSWQPCWQEVRDTHILVHSVDLDLRGRGGAGPNDIKATVVQTVSETETLPVWNSGFLFRTLPML